MKKFNLFAVAFVAVFTQSVNANTAKDFRGAKIGTENSVNLIEKKKDGKLFRGESENTNRNVYVFAKKEKADLAPQDARLKKAPFGKKGEKIFRGESENTNRHIFVSAKKEKAETLLRGAIPEKALRGALQACAKKDEVSRNYPRTERGIGKVFAWPNA